MTSQSGQQIITLHVLPNTSGSKGTQAMKFGQLVEYKVRNIFLKDSCGKLGWETSFRPLYFFCFLKNVKTSSQHLSLNICQ